MNADQTSRLSALSEKLADVFMVDANPVNWPGAGTPAAAMTAQERGDRNWSLKNANQLGALLARTLDLRDRMNGGGLTPPPADDAADADIARYEREAKRLLEAAAGRGR